MLGETSLKDSRWDKEQVNYKDDTQSLGSQVSVVTLTRSVFLYKKRPFICPGLYSHSHSRKLRKHAKLPAGATHEALHEQRAGAKAGGMLKALDKHTEAHGITV